MIADYTAARVKKRYSTHLFNRKAPSPTLQVSVIVPVRNEAHHLAKTLESLRLQQNAVGQPLNPAIYEVLVLVNNCTDASLVVAQSYQKRYPDFSLHLADIQLPPPKANIGAVRRLLMDEACRRLTSVGKTEGIIASTDGDTVVDSQWLWHVMNEIRQGADAVGGRILTHPDKNPVRLFHLRDVTYRTLVARLESQLDPVPHDPWPRHFQHFGANLAVTCAMYQKAGRLPEVPYLEDEAFYKALVRVDARVRQSPLVRVTTSARMQGRVAVGFSEQLRCWATMHKSGQCQLAEPAGAWAVKFAARHQLRTLWINRWNNKSGAGLDQIAANLCISADWLNDAFQHYCYFGEFWQAVESQTINDGGWVARWPLVPIGESIKELRRMGARIERME
jgi:glycosyltransferase involved in cell wall biosynthesis